MNYSNESKINQTISFANSLNGLSLLIILAFAIFCFGCNKSVSNSETEILEENDEYYVKYEVNSSTIYMGGKLEVSISNDTNTNTTIIIDRRNLWQVVIGPVQKGFKASLNVNALGSTQNRLTIYTAIYVSKNNSPFALKEIDGSETPRDNVQISYTIDY